MNVEDLLNHIRCKQFFLAKEKIRNSVLSEHQALLVIYEIARAIMNQQILTCNAKGAYISLLKEYKIRTLHLIQNYTGENLVRYYNCVVFIVNYLSSEALVELLELRELILLDPANVSNNEKAKRLYVRTYSIIYKRSIEAYNKVPLETIELFLLQLEMRLIIKEDFTNNISSSFPHFCYLNITAEEQQNCLIKILSIQFSSDGEAKDNYLCYYSAIFKALQNIAFKAVKELYEVDFSSVILSLKKQINLGAYKSTPAIIQILTLLNNKNLPLLHEAIKTDALIIGDSQVISDIYYFIATVMQTWINSGSHYIEHFSDFIKIVKIILQHFTANMKTCQCCSVNADASNSLQLLMTTVELVKIGKLNDYRLNQLLEPITHIATQLLPQLKSANCKNFGRQWAKCSSILNSIGCAMLTSKNSNGAKFLQLLMKQIGKLGFSSNFTQGTLYFIHQLIDFYKEQCDEQSAMLFAAIAIYIDTDNADKLFHPYNKALQIINDKLSSEKQFFGVAHILNTNIDFARTYIPSLTKQINKYRTKELLILELNFYLNKWKNKPYIISIVKQLTKCSNSETIAAIIEKHYTYFLRADSELLLLFESLLSDLKKSSLSSAVLHFLVANIIVYNLVRENEVDMNNTVVASKVPSFNYGPAPDPNDTCDIVSSYSSLSLKNYKTILTHLESTLLDIKECYDKLEEVSDLERAFDVCTRLAHSFRLHYNFAYSESTWLLAETIATKLQDDKKILEAVGWLLHKADSNENTQQLLVLGNTIAKDICSEKNSLRLGWYHLHVCYFHLNNCRWDLAKEEYKITSKWMKLTDFSKEHQTRFDIHFEFLKSAMSRVPCEAAINRNHHKPEFVPKRALKMLVNFLNESGYIKADAFHLVTYFEEIDDVLARVSFMRLPREMRLYGKELVTISQKLVLSLRSVRVLTSLAKADIFSGNMNDCHVKVDGIAEILNLPVLKTRNSECAAKDNCKENYNEIIDCKLVDQIREMQLNVPQASSIFGSPKFKKKLYNFMYFINHAEKCSCFECTTPEYAILILRKLHIHFLICEYESDPSMSEAIYEMILKIYNFLMTRSNKFNKIVCRDYKKVFNETYAYFLLDYSLKPNLIQDHFSLAKEMNQKVIDLVKDNNSYDSDLLLCEAKEQRYLFTIHENFLKTSETLDNANDEKELQESIVKTMDKTPENKSRPKKMLEPKVIISEHVNERRIKSIPFNISDDDVEGTLKPPSQLKFKVFDETSKPSSSKTSSRKNTTTKATLNTAFFYPTTASSSKVKERTAQRTKVLTGQLKKSTKKPKDGDSSDSDKEVFARPKGGVRKNLLQELKDCGVQTPKLNAVNHEDGIRRSARRK